ncbi:MAG: mechanosensitive ion channel family protein [Melioribacteraceae bacterium]|nr:mechanosensitive ion channel family protein [Melioribacteraceae bacterium]
MHSAAQAILGDLFSYFVIYFDRPFELGDFVVFDDKIGVIEKIGIKSTRIRTLRGEMLVTSNSNLTNAHLHNFKQMERRRVTFKVGVVYQTKADQLTEIPKIIKQIIDDNELATFDRAHFFQYADFSLDFETVYYVETNDYIKYMDAQQEINLKIYKEFEERGIEFAYPTRTLYMKSENEN